jgi:very-short-patch-repair endonuclease
MPAKGWKCTPEQKARYSAAVKKAWAEHEVMGSRGKKLSVEHRAKISAVHKNKEITPEQHLSYATARKEKKTFQSAWEKKILPYIKEFAPDVVEQEVLGGRWNGDFYFPEQRLLVEIDGHGIHKMWHDPENEKFRSDTIMSDGISILRLEMKKCGKDRAKIAASIIQQNLVNRDWQGMKHLGVI